VQKAEPTPVYQIKKRGQIPIVEKRRANELTKALEKGQLASPKDESMKTARSDVLESYMQAVQELSASPNSYYKKLAMQIATMCQNMPRPISRDTRILEHASATIANDKKIGAVVPTTPKPFDDGPKLKT
jgi:hypothetical protein